MINKHRKRIYLIIILFLIISFISVTYAWFTFSGIVGASTTATVKAWYIEFRDDEDVVTNDIVISSNDIYPGMETIHEEVTIDNLGDSNALLSILVNEARIMNIDEYKLSESLSSMEIQDKLAHEYPFKINIELMENVLEPKTSTTFAVSISWPADSGDDALDTYWGQEAYKFNVAESNNLALDSTYQMKKPLELRITVLAEQDLRESNSYDEFYQTGDIVLIDVVANTGCTSIGGSCIKTTVIETSSLVGDSTVSLLPDIKSSFSSGSYDNYDTLMAGSVSGWTVSTRTLEVDDILKVISKDVTDTIFKSDNTSNMIVGSLLFNERINSEVLNAVSLNGHYTYLNTNFDYLNSANCVWTKTNYNTENAFALVNESALVSKLYGENKTATCKVVPVIVANKENLTTN